MRTGVPVAATTAANQQWALDFASDAIATGRKIRVLSVIDTFTRECLALEVDTSFASRPGHSGARTDHPLARIARTDTVRQRSRANFAPLLSVVY
jgi:putative transposase